MPEQEAAYFFCNACRRYLPAWHPKALSFWTEHSTCSTSKPQRHTLNGTEVLVVGEKELPCAVSYGLNAPEGYVPDVPLGPLEELAYCGNFGSGKLL